MKNECVSSTGFPTLNGIHQQREHLQSIVSAITSATDPYRLLTERLTLESPNDVLTFDGHPVSGVSNQAVELKQTGRVCVVGGGKAAAGFAAGLEHLLGKERLQKHRVHGLVSVPEGCAVQLDHVELRETRARGNNLPTEAVIRATHEMLKQLRSLEQDDLAFVLVTGGASALLESPRAPISLQALAALTKNLSNAGVEIETLNAIRCMASNVKAGGLANSCTAGRLIVLVLSDVLDDSLEVIGSGPCAPHTIKRSAIEQVLFDPNIPQYDRRIISEVAREYSKEHDVFSPSKKFSSNWVTPRGCRVTHLMLGTNALAVEAATAASSALGYKIFSTTTSTDSQTANRVGSRLAASLITMSSLDATRNYPQALLEGGEATVRVPSKHGVGGRNQHTVIAAAHDILIHQKRTWPTGTLIASFGTDGEDGPTSAAGGFIDSDIAESLGTNPNSIADAIYGCNSYELLKSAGGLIETGPTGTNVADIRIVLTQPTSD